MSAKRSLNLASDRIRKRSRKSVSLGTKLEVLRRIEASEKIVAICKALGLAKSTVQTIRANKDKINIHLESATLLNASKLTRKRSSNMERMEKLLNAWIEDNSERGILMSQTTIQKQAKSIFEHLKREDSTGGPANETFQASRGWFEKFKNRHNYNVNKVKAEAPNVDAALDYPSMFTSIIESAEYVPQQDYSKRIPAKIAPPDGRCSSCACETDNQSAIHCEGQCNRWFHLKCIKLTKKQFKSISNLGSAVLWFCEACKVWLAKVKQRELNVTQTQTTLLEDTLLAITARLQNIEARFQENDNVHAKFNTVSYAEAILYPSS